MGTYFMENQLNAIKYVHGKCKHLKLRNAAYLQKGKQQVTLLSVYDEPWVAHVVMNLRIL